MMRHRRCGFACIAIAAIFLTSLSDLCLAQVSFTGTYSQNFNSGLPLDKSNGSSLGSSPIGWQDNLSTTYVPGNTNFGLQGWYLYHPTTQGEGGSNGHQRLRFGNGSSNTGAYWLYASDPDGAGPETPATNTEKALGMLNASTLAGDGANAYYGLRLTNNTGNNITSFTLDFDGEQWRDGEGVTPETVNFGYSTAATDTTWATTATYNSVPQLSFSSLVTGGTNAAVDGNVAGLQHKTANVFGLNWAAGSDIWLRWADPQLAGLTDDGFAIDNIVLVAPSTGPPPDINSVTSGNSSAGSTWSDGNPPANGMNYHVQSGHTVTVDAPFAGSLLKAETGGHIDIGPGANGTTFSAITVSSGATLTESVSGDFALGNATSGILQLDNNVSFTIDPGPASATCDLCLNMKIQGNGNIDIDSAPGTSASITRAAAHGGTINFNGTGDVVKVEGESIAKLVMNSTGANKVVFTNADVTSLTFNQAGIIDHATTTASRLQGGGLAANAQVTLDLTKGYPDNTTQSDERRFQTTGFSGSGNVIVNGTTTDYTNAAGDVTLNEFEVGTTGQPTGAVPNSGYSGTVTFNDYINGELRQNLRRAGVVVNNHARVEFGFQVAHPDATKFLNVGEIAVNNGGTLEVGFEQGPVANSPFYPTSPTQGVGNHVARLNITNVGGRSGGLTMTSGSTLRMQINGLNADQFDTITATGNVNLGGATLDLLANAVSTNTDALDAYFPTDGDTFTLISIGPAAVQGDYDGSGTVDQADYNAWRAAFGTTANFNAADGNNNGVVDAGDYVVWLKHLGQTASITGSISGDITINKIDPFGSWGAFTIEKIITATSLQIKFHNAGSGASLSAVPEPSTLFLGSLLFASIAAMRRGRGVRRV